MLASEMIKTIKHVEKECHGITKMYKSRIAYFQSQNLPETQGVEYDEAFDDFVYELESVLDVKVYIPTAKKILNNWYLWAKENLETLGKIKPFKEASDPIDWLIVNDFRIVHADFAKDVTEEMINEVKLKMPKDSELYKQLKEVADKSYSGPRGFNYDYLIKVVAGFSEAWK